MQNFCYNTPCSAGVAHPVERHLAKVEVASSSLVARSKKEVTFVYQKLLLFLSKPQAWYIITARSAVYIISPYGAVSHHASVCISLRLDDIPQQVADDIQCFALVICNGKPLIYFQKYGIMRLKREVYMAKNSCWSMLNSLQLMSNCFVKTLKHRPILFSKFAKVPVAFMPIFVKPITDKAKRICSRNLKLPSRNVVKQKDGYNCCSTHR